MSQEDFNFINHSGAEFIRSNKGGLKIIYKNHMYTFHKRTAKNIIWRCVKRSAHCRGSMHTTINYDEPREKIPHDHQPNLAAVETARSKFEFRQQSDRDDNRVIDDDDCNSDKIISNNQQNVSTNEVLQSHTQGIPTQPKPVRLAQQSAIRQQAKNSLRTKSYQSQQQQHEQQQKTVVLKTIPLKVKQVSSAGTGKTSSKSQPAARIPQNTTYPQQPTEVCLRWNSYHSNMQNSFPSLLDSEEFVDVTLACEGRSLKCHKMILSSCSDYLAALLRENPCQHPIILMKDLKFWEVEALVKFMYRGEVNVAHDKLPQLLNAAEALQVKGLAGPCPSQNQKPPNLVPQPKKTQSTPPQVSKPTPETKESKTSASIPSLTSPKRVPKRPHPHPESKDVIKPLTKIRLQRTTSTSSPPAVKLEPLDIPLSPTDMFPDNNDDSSITNYEHLMSMHEDVPGRDEPLDNTDGDIEFCSLSGPSDLNDGDENMEFVPTDFLDQEQDIVEDADGDCSKSSNEETSAKDIELKEVDDEIEDREDGVKNYDDGHGCKAEIT
ncbi:protein tramtrack, beta isoform isoform X2 [Microplitis demolitor]|uniref:protein tramtrack, beta isoform isoform X2 n=1 Tax=Microplitis demolitor TaxID=69319 RepID=UPI00235B5BAD|nr:protein tramtrack, beta isoform isoform X2 [Microplitis demolitor]